MDPRIEQRLQAMYGNKSPLTSTSRSSTAADRDDLIAKYSKLVSDSSASTSKMQTVSIVDVADSFGAQGIETVNFDTMTGDISLKFENKAETFPDLVESLSTETAELIRQAISVKREADDSVRGHSSSRFVSPPKNREFKDYLEESEILQSAQSRMTHPASNKALVKDPPCDAYDEAQRLLQNARMFEREINRVALEPPECYNGPKVSPRLDGLKLRGYDAPSYEKYSTPYYSPSNDTSSIKSFHGHSSKRVFTNDYMKHQNGSSSINSASSFRSANSVPANKSGVNPILEDLNLRSKELKYLLEREKNLELNKSSSTWSDVRLNDIDSRLEYLKKRCSDLRQCAEMPSHTYHAKEVKFADTISNQNSPHGASIGTASSCDKSISPGSAKSDLKSLEIVNSILDERASQAVKPVALKVLSERVLSGYRITRETCAKCGVSKLAKRDSSVDHAECVFCPINDLRTQIRNGVARKILASKLLMGSSTLSRGKLCELCVSPTLIQPDGTVICEVCPVLDTVCLEVAKEQRQGGNIMKGVSCNECGASKVSNNNGFKCLACAVMKEWQQQQQQQLKQIQQVEPSAHKHADVADIKQQPSQTEISEVKSDGSNLEAIKSTNSQHNEAASEQPVSPQPQQKHKIFESLMGQCGVLSGNAPDKEVPLNISNLQSQLLQELAKAKQCQIVLENSIGDPNVNAEGGDNVPSPKDLEEELAKAKRCQYALERIIETTSNMEQFPVIEDTPPEIEDTMSAPDLKGSFSISQQEVEAGQPKEYIPPPSFFRSGIPSMVEVTLITPAPDSNLAQAYQTNLKATDNDKKLVSKSKVGIDFWPFTKADNGRREEEEQGGFDYDTIQTDDFTVDYTLNTMDDSRLEYLHVRSKKVNRVRFQEDEEENEREAQAAGCSFINCFGCGGDEGYEGRQDRDVQRESPSPSRFEPNHEQTRYEPPSQTTSNECSNTSTVSNQVSRSTGPAWIGGGPNKDCAVQQPTPSAANDYSEISDVSDHVIRPRPTRNISDRYEVNSATPKWNTTSGNSAVSDISGSIYPMQDASVSSGNSGSFVKSYGRNTAVSNKRLYGERFSSKMGVLLEDESVDTSIDKYMLHPSRSGNHGNTAQMKRIIQEFERSNPSTFGM